MKKKVFITLSCLILFFGGVSYYTVKKYNEKPTKDENKTEKVTKMPSMAEAREKSNIFDLLFTKSDTLKTDYSTWKENLVNQYVKENIKKYKPLDEFAPPNFKEYVIGYNSEPYSAKDILTKYYDTKIENYSNIGPYVINNIQIDNEKVTYSISSKSINLKEIETELSEIKNEYFQYSGIYTSYLSDNEKIKSLGDDLYNKLFYYINFKIKNKTILLSDTRNYEISFPVKNGKIITDFNSIEKAISLLDNSFNY